MPKLKPGKNADIGLRQSDYAKHDWAPNLKIAVFFIDDRQFLRCMRARLEPISGKIRGL